MVIIGCIQICLAIDPDVSPYSIVDRPRSRHDALITRIRATHTNRPQRGRPQASKLYSKTLYITPRAICDKSYYWKEKPQEFIHGNSHRENNNNKNKSMFARRVSGNTRDRRRRQGNACTDTERTRPQAICIYTHRSTLFLCFFPSLPRWYHLLPTKKRDRSDEKTTTQPLGFFS